MGETRSTCPYCGVGCGVIIEHEHDRITGVRGDPLHPANFGQLCSKGRTLHRTAAPSLRPARLLQPLLRRRRDDGVHPVDWNEALTTATDRFANCIREHGPDSVAFYISGQLLTEDYYVFNKLAKGLIGTNNVDTNSRLCMSSAVAGYKQTLGADAPPTCYEDIDHAACLFIAGSNAAWTHPILFRRIEAARARNPQQKVIVVDPRRTATAAVADLHLAIEPGTDVALFHGMLHCLLWEDGVARDFIRDHTAGFEALKEMVRDLTPRLAAEICGISEADLTQAARWFAQGPTLSLYCQGLNQSSSGTAKNAALINLHLATGQIGRVGAGPFSLTGQPNAMGGREVGGLANLLSAHRDLDNPQHRAEVAALWGVADVPARPGLTAVELFDALAAGTVKMVWIACTNPAQSMPDQATVRAGLARAEFVVLQEAYQNTETSPYADLQLPATTWGEKEGTVTNSERRISRVRAALEAPGAARADWAIAAEFGRQLEQQLRPGLPTLFPWVAAGEVFDEHARTTRGRDLDITGLSHATLDATGPQQWPCPQGSVEGVARLYTDHRFATADGRAQFAAVKFKPVAERVDARYPFRLNTGRLRDQWHGMTRTGTVAALYAHMPEPALEMHPADLTRRGLASGDLVRVESRRGNLLLPIVATEVGQPGNVYVPMHWGSSTLGGRDGAGINAVTAKAFCPSSKQPELKHAAVRISRQALPWRLVAFGYPPSADELIALRDALRTQAAAFDYASVVLIGGERDGVFLRAAAATAVNPSTIEAIDQLFGLDATDVLRYDDSRRTVGRRIRVVESRLAAVRLSGEVAAEGWLRDWLTSAQDVSLLRSQLMSPSALPPMGQRSRGRTLCNCVGVAEADITAAIAASQGPPDAVLEAVQGQLRCGTECGSCLPELRALIAAAGAAKLEAA